MESFLMMTMRVVMVMTMTRLNMLMMMVVTMMVMMMVMRQRLMNKMLSFLNTVLLMTMMVAWWCL